MGKKHRKSELTTPSNCYICEHIYDCRSIVNIRKKHAYDPDLLKNDLPDLNLIDLFETGFFLPVKCEKERVEIPNEQDLSNYFFGSSPVFSQSTNADEAMPFEDYPCDKLGCIRMQNVESSKEQELKIKIKLPQEKLNQLRDYQAVQVKQSSYSSSDDMARHSSSSLNNPQGEEIVGFDERRPDLLLNTKDSYSPEQTLKPSKKGFKKIKKLKLQKNKYKIVEANTETLHDHSDMRYAEDSSCENNAQDEDIYGNEAPTPDLLSDVQAKPVPEVHELKPLKIRIKLCKQTMKKQSSRKRKYNEESSDSSSDKLPRNCSSPIYPQDENRFGFEEPTPDSLSKKQDHIVPLQNMPTHKNDGNRLKIPQERTQFWDSDPDVFEPPTVTEYGTEIDNELANHLEYYATNRLREESRKELTDTHRVPSNCTRIGTPILNSEVRAALPENLLTLDESIEARKKLLAKGILCYASAISDQISRDDKNQELLKNLMDTARLLCDMQHSESMTRRNSKTFSIRKDLDEQLCNTKINEHLCGKKRSEEEKRVHPESISGEDQNDRMIQKRLKLSNYSSGSGDTKELRRKKDNMKIKPLENVGETNIQMSLAAGGPPIQTNDCDANVWALTPYQLQPVSNPFDKGANYFKDDGASCSWQEPCTASLNKTTSIDDHCTNVTAQEIETKARTGFPQLPRKKKTLEALKIIYFRKQIKNAFLMHKKLKMEIRHYKQEHRLKMLILKKQADSLK